QRQDIVIGADGDALRLAERDVHVGGAFGADLVELPDLARLALEIPRAGHALHHVGDAAADDDASQGTSDDDGERSQHGNLLNQRIRTPGDLISDESPDGCLTAALLLPYRRLAGITKTGR